MARRNDIAQVDQPPVEELPVVDELGEIEELPTDVETVEDGPAKRQKIKQPAQLKAVPIEFGAAWLTEHLNSLFGKTWDQKNVRTMLRTLISQGKIERGDGRYNFTGPDDPRVQVLVGHLQGLVNARLEREALAAKVAEQEAARKAKAGLVEGDAPVEELESLEF